MSTNGMTGRTAPSNGSARAGAESGAARTGWTEIGGSLLVPSEVEKFIYRTWGSVSFELQALPTGELKVFVWIDYYKYKNGERADYEIVVGRWKVLSSKRIVYQFDPQWKFEWEIRKVEA